MDILLIQKIKSLEKNSWDFNVTMRVSGQSKEALGWGRIEIASETIGRDLEFDETCVYDQNKPYCTFWGIRNISNTTVAEFEHRIKTN